MTNELQVISQCFNCRNYFGAGLCFGFDDKDGKIPMEIFTNDFRHTKSFAGDNGIQFEPLEDK